MTEALFLLAGGLLAGAAVWAQTQAERTRVYALLSAETARVTELLALVEAKAAPAEYFAVTAAPAAEPEEWLWSDDGLVGYRASDLEF